MYRKWENRGKGDKGESMDERMIFAVLGIEKTKEENVIRTAYRTLLIQTNPEDNPEGFKRLREAYEQALVYAREQDEATAEEPEDNTPVGLWMKRVKEVYGSLSKRLDEEQWKRLLHEDICMDLEYGEEAKWRLFRFLAEHFRLTSGIYRILNDFYHIDKDTESFQEHLPVDFVNFILQRIGDTEGNMDFSYDELEGADDADYDAFLEYYNTLADQTQNDDKDAASQTVRAMKELHISHPLFLLEQSRTAFLCGDEEKALAIIRPLLTDKAESLRIQVLGAEILYKCGLKDEAAQIFERYAEGGYYMVEKYLTFYEKERGNHGKAIKHCLKALRDGNDGKLEELLGVMDKEFIELYGPKAEEHTLTKEDAAVLMGCYSRLDRAQEALDFLEKYPDYAGEMERIHDYLCSLYFQVKRFEDSIAESHLWRENISEENEQKRIERTARSYVFEGEGWNQLGAAGQEGAYKKAKECYEAAVRIEPKDPVLKQKVLDIVITMKEYEKAIELADELIAENAGWFPAYAQKQKACFELHKAQEVIDSFYDAKNIYPGYAGIYERAAEVFCIFGQYGDADDIFEQAKAAKVKSPRLDMLALRCLRLKEWKEQQDRRSQGLEPLTEEDIKETTRYAETLKARYDKCPVDDETMSELYQELGLLQRDRRKFDEARQAFKKAISYQDRPYVHYLLANALFDDNKGEEALKEYKIYEETAGPDENLYVNMARCYRFSGMPEKAMEFFKKVLEVNPENDEANGSIAALYRNRMIDTGNKYYGRLGLPYSDRQLELTPEDGYYLRERGLLYMEMNEFEKALADFEVSLRVDPECPYGHNLKGKTLYYLGRNEEALECFELALKYMESNDMFTAPFLNAGDCRRREGDIAAAADYYRRGIKAFWNVPRDVFYKRLFFMYRTNGMFQEARAVLDEQWEQKQISQEDYEEDCLIIDTLIHNHAGESYIKRAEKLTEAWDSAETWRELSYQYLYEGDNPKKALEAAGKAYDKAKEHKALAEDEVLQLIRCCVLYGDKEMAVRYSEKFLQAILRVYSQDKERDAIEQYLDDTQSDVDHAFNLAEIYLAMGNITQAETCLHEMEKRKMCRKCSQRGCSEYLVLLGMILEEKGEAEKAAEQYEKALFINKALRYPRYRLKKLTTGKKKWSLAKLLRR